MALSVPIQVVTATIGVGAALSGPVAIGAMSLVGIVMPAAWTAAAITFQASPDGGTTWYNVFTQAGSEMTATVAAGQFIAIDPSQWRGINMIQVRSGTSASPVNQTAGAAIGLVTRPVY